MSTSHPTSISLSTSELASKLASLRYDALADFLGHLAKTISSDMAKDLSSGKVQLASKLEALVSSLKEAEKSAELVWQVCHRHE